MPATLFRVKRCTKPIQKQIYLERKASVFISPPILVSHSSRPFHRNRVSLFIPLLSTHSASTTALRVPKINSMGFPFNNAHTHAYISRDIRRLSFCSSVDKSPLLALNVYRNKQTAFTGQMFRIDWGYSILINYNKWLYYAVRISFRYYSATLLGYDCNKVNVSKLFWSYTQMIAYLHLLQTNKELFT